MGKSPKTLGLFLCCFFLYSINLIASDAQRLVALNTRTKQLATRLGDYESPTRFDTISLEQLPRSRREIVDIGQKKKGLLAKICGYCCCYK
jgi:hypothetical protein